ncbi:MAG: JAB domain-containing protein [Verrucomicrobiota bacterium]
MPKQFFPDFPRADKQRVRSLSDVARIMQELPWSTEEEQLGMLMLDFKRHTCAPLLLAEGREAIMNVSYEDMFKPVFESDSVGIFLGHNYPEKTGRKHLTNDDLRLANAATAVGNMIGRHMLDYLALLPSKEIYPEGYCSAKQYAYQEFDWKRDLS